MFGSPVASTLAGRPRGKSLIVWGEYGMQLNFVNFAHKSREFLNSHEGPAPPRLLNPSGACTAIVDPQILVKYPFADDNAFW